MAWSRRRSMLLIVMGGLSVIALWLVYCHLNRTFHNAAFAAHDMVAGLIYYAEAHGGKLPPSKAEFLGSRFLEHCADGSIVIHAEPQSQYYVRTHEREIVDVDEFHIPWGLDITTLGFGEQEALTDAQGREVLLIQVHVRGRLQKELSRIMSGGLAEVLQEISDTSGQ